MSSDTVKTPRPRRLILAGAVTLVFAGAVAAHGIIQRSNTAQQVARWTDQQAIPTVNLAKVTAGQGQTLTLPGTIQAFRKAAIYARVSGYLKSWQTDIGAHVQPGQVLAVIDTPDLDQQLAQAKATLASAQANAQVAALNAQRTGILAQKQIASQQSADNATSDAAAKKAVADAAQANLRQLEAMESFKTVVAPFDGVVTARNTDIGALINAGAGTGQELFEVSDMDTVRIYVQVPQAFTAQLRPRMNATFELPQYPGQHFDAKLVTTSNALDAASRSMLVELQADNSKGMFSPGNYSQIQFQITADANVLDIPATALISGDQGMQVATLGQDNKVVLKPVQIGRDFGNSVEVVAGLSPSDRVIDSPPETLQSGDLVRLAGANPLSVPTNAPVPTPHSYPAARSQEPGISP
jgi:RND family efflux transporter MFP subunit